MAIRFAVRLVSLACAFNTMVIACEFTRRSHRLLRAVNVVGLFLFPAQATGPSSTSGGAITARL